MVSCGFVSLNNVKRAPMGALFLVNVEKSLDIPLGYACILSVKEGDMTMEKKSKKKVAVIAALVMIALMTLYLMGIVIPLVRETMGVGVAVTILVIYGAVILASIVGVTLALRQRLKEIESGEEDEAKRY